MPHSKELVQIVGDGCVRLQRALHVALTEGDARLQQVSTAGAQHVDLVDVERSRQQQSVETVVVDQPVANGLQALEQSITAEFAMTPEDFKEDYLSEQGAGFSIAPIFRQSAWFRFHNRAEGIRNLYLVGAGTHPGAGVPGVLCSAKAVDALIAPAADV